MTTKKKAKKKSTQPKGNARKKPTPTKTVKRHKKLSRKRSAPKSAKKKKASGKKQARKKSERLGVAEFSREGVGSRLGERSGDLQGLSRLEGADSESVDELVAEGNAFEADAVIGLEDAESADEREVRTHEVPEDDVPNEYLDKD
jgi:hypothetical protein